MKIFFRPVLFLLVVVAVLLPFHSYATHALGADISYTYVSPNTYNITYSFYRNCGPSSQHAPDTVSLSIGSHSCGLTLAPVVLRRNNGCLTPNGHADSTQLPGVCNQLADSTTCQAGFLPGVQVYAYCGQVVLPQACSDWVISYAECCRNNNISNIPNAANYELYVSATINNTNNLAVSSPYFTTDPSQIFCSGYHYCYNNGTVNTSGDSLVFSLVPAQDFNGVALPYSAGYSATQPVNVANNDFSFDTGTGEICFTPNGVQVDVIAVQVDIYRRIAGVVTLVGRTRRDIQFNIQSSSFCSSTVPTAPTAGNLSAGALADSVTVEICSGHPITFSVVSKDTTGNTVVMSSNVSTAIPGATFAITGNGTSTATGSFSWSPTLANVGLNFFTVNVLNNACPIPGSISRVIKVQVFGPVVPITSAPAACGDSVQLFVASGTVFNWTPTTGLGCTNCRNPKALPPSATVYTVSTDCGSASVQVNIGTGFTLSTNNDATICLNGSVPVNSTVTGGLGPFKYSWTPAGPSNIISNDTILNPIVSPTTTTEYVLTATSSEGCVREDSFKVTINGVAPVVNASASPDTICPGGTVQLNLQVVPASCGLSSTPCPNNFDYTVGNATTYLAGAGALPSVFGNSHQDGKNQILYKAADLYAQGIHGGTINKIAFDVAVIQGDPTMCEFTIRMKCTNSNGLNNWDSIGLSTVYGNHQITIAAGWNYFVLDNPYDWDGVSDLLLDICYNNSAASCTHGGSSSNNPVYYTTTAYNSVLYNKLDFDPNFCTDVYGLPGMAISTNRPNTIFSICSSVLPPGATVSWLPTAGISNPGIVNPMAQVFHTTTYTASVSVGGCTGTGFVTVYNSNNLSVDAGKDTNICISTPIPLVATVTGSPSPVALTCGDHGTVCGGASTQFTIGSGSANEQNVTPYHGAEQIEHFQTLFRASELIAAGMTRGTIQDLAFLVNTNVSGAGQFTAFNIKMGCTAQDTLTTTFLTGLTNVYGPTNVATFAGWNSYTLTAPYDWDGTSNIVVEICFTNASSIGSDIVKVTSTGFASTLYNAVSFTGGTGCALTTGSTSPLRPNTRFSICPPPLGTFQYTWTPIVGTGPTLIGASTMVTPTSTVDYQVQVTDGFCYVYDTIKINFLNGYQANLTGHNLGCAGSNTGDISAAPTLGSPPYTFVWSDAASTTLQTTANVLTDTIKGLAAGLYRIKITDKNGCQGIDSFTLTVPPALKFDSVAIKNVSCNGGADGTATAFMSGGSPPYTYAWSTANTTSGIIALAAGPQTLTVTDSSGCVKDTGITITQPAPIADIMGSTIVSCFGGHDGIANITSITGGSGNFSEAWSNSGTGLTITGLTTGEYYVTITDNVGVCTKTDSVNVGQNPAYVISFSNVDSTTCFNLANGQAIASVAGDTVDYTFLWDNGETNAQAMALAHGERHVTLTNTLGCAESDSVAIGAPPEFTLSTTVVDSISCFGNADGSASVSVTSVDYPPYTYNWSNLQTGDTAANLAQGTYYVTVYDAHSCPEYGSVVVPQPNVLSAVGGSVPATCFGGKDGKVFVTVTGGTPRYIYEWNNGGSQDTLSNLQKGTYSVTVTDGHNCSATAFNISVSQPPTPVSVKSVNVINVSCHGNNDGAIFAVGTGGTGPYGYTLNNGPKQSNGNFNPLAPDSNYVLTITDSNNCPVHDTLAVTQPDTFGVVFMPPTDTIKIGDSVTLKAIVAPLGQSDRYSWTPSISLNCDTCTSVLAKPYVSTVYELTVSRPTPDSNECSRKARVEVVVINQKILYIPNAFSPNDDGVNDTFQVHAPGGVGLKMQIFDRWGEQVFYYKGDMTGGWDGKFNGNFLPPNVFVYYIEVTYLDNEVRTAKGSITTIK